MDSPTRSPLASGEWRSLWIAEALSVAGDQLARVAISVLVYQRTSSAALTAITYAMTFLPDVIAGPLLSGLADRFPRRTVMTCCTVLQAGLVAVMAVPGAPIWLVGGCVAGVAAVQAPFKAAQNAFVRVLLDNSHLTVGQARLTTLREMGQLSGLVGAAGVVGLLGTTVALLLDMLTFLVAAALLRFGLRQRPAARSERAPLLRRMLPPSRRRRALATLSILLALTVLPHGLIVPLAAEIGAPTWSIGLILAADSAGFLIGAAIVGRTPRPRNVEDGWIGPLSMLCMGALVLFVFRPHAIVVAVLLAASSIGAAYHILARSAYIEMLPDELTGRATGLVRTGLRAGQGLGVAFGGVAAEWMGSPALTISAAGTVGVIGCSLAWLVVKRNPAPTPTQVANVNANAMESISSDGRYTPQAPPGREGRAERTKQG
ncbi:MAG: MFS transporter [Pseudonocardiaceae bacterium]|nr:MFS transporter [Pseudonocardiaceae bacterium]